MTEKLIPVKEVAKKAGVTYRTLSFYREIGLIPKNKRIKGHSLHIWGYPVGTIEKVIKIRKLAKRPTLRDILKNPGLLNGKE